MSGQKEELPEPTYTPEPSYVLDDRTAREIDALGDLPSGATPSERRAHLQRKLGIMRVKQ